MENMLCNGSAKLTTERAEEERHRPSAENHSLLTPPESAIWIAMQTKGLIGPLNVKNMFPIKENMWLTMLMLLCYFWGDGSQLVWKSENCIELSKERCNVVNFMITPGCI